MSQRAAASIGTVATGVVAVASSDAKRAYSIAPEENMVERKPVILNVKKLKTHAVHHTTALLSMKQVFFDRNNFAYGDPQWAVAWIDRSSSAYFRSLYLHQKINHIPGVEQLGRKKLLVKAFGELVASPVRSDFAFFPRSWTLMNEYNALLQAISDQRKLEDDQELAYRAEVRRVEAAKAADPSAEVAAPAPPPNPMTYILKPGSACQGRGISLFMTPDKIKRVVGNVVQEYIANPLLIRGKKFDLRIYVLITSVAPLRMYVYQDGLARFCTEDYIAPAPDNLSRLYGHLTNFSLNKTNHKFVHNDDENETAGDGSKWTLDGWNDYMAATYGEASLRLVWARIHAVLTKTILTSLPTMRAAYRQLYPDEGFGGHCFQLVGFDVMLDSDLRPWLIEVNRNPSLRCDSPLDQKIKTAILGQTFYLLDAAGYIHKLLANERLAVAKVVAHLRARKEEAAASGAPRPSAFADANRMTVAELTSIGVDAAHLPRSAAESILGRAEVDEYRERRRGYELSLRLAHEDSVIAAFARKVRDNAMGTPAPSGSSPGSDASGESSDAAPETTEENDGSRSKLFARRKPTESIVNLPGDAIAAGLKPPRQSLRLDADRMPYYSSCFQRLFPLTPFVDYPTAHLPSTVEAATALVFDPARDLAMLDEVRVRRGLEPLLAPAGRRENDGHLANGTVLTATLSGENGTASSDARGSTKSPGASSSLCDAYIVDSDDGKDEEEPIHEGDAEVDSGDESMPTSSPRHQGPRYRPVPNLVDCIEEKAAPATASRTFEHVMQIPYTPAGAIALDQYHYALGQAVSAVQKDRRMASVMTALSARIQPLVPPAGNADTSDSQASQGSAPVNGSMSSVARRSLSGRSLVPARTPASVPAPPAGSAAQDAGPDAGPRPSRSQSHGNEEGN